MVVGTPAGNSPVDQPVPGEEVSRENAKKDQSQEKTRNVCQ